MKPIQHSGAWMRSPKLLTPQGFKLSGARSGASTCVKANVGDAPIVEGPVIPRTFAPAPSWSVDGHRIKAPLEYSRGDDKVWIYRALRVRDGKEITRCAAARNSKNYLELLKDIEADNPMGDIFIVPDNLSSHSSLETRTWLAEHPRLQHVFTPKGACWLNLQEGWWWLFRRDAFAGQSFANADEIERAMQVATAQLNHRAKPWIWGRPPKMRRHLHRLFCYRL